MIDALSPSLLFLIGAVFIPFLRGRAREVYLLLVPVLAGFALIHLPEGRSGIVEFIGHTLVLNRVDKLSFLFGIIYVGMGFVGMLYSMHVKETGEQVAAFLYIGSALGAVFAGDLLTLFIFWELMAFSSLYLIWARRTPASRSAGLRYVMVHLFGGLLLMTGILLHISSTGSVEFDYLGLNGAASWLILAGIGLNAAMPPFHNWLTDAYPEATVTGTVFLSCFTTKTAIYALARAFPGAEILIVIGVVMTIFPIFYAVIENDTRRTLSYSLINQVGFMVVGIGIGTATAVNGAVAHAFVNILFKGLLFMCAGSVIYMTGKSKFTDLGGLYKTMPVTLVFCLVGAASISAFPLFSGFVSKSLIISQAADQGMPFIWLLLMFASAGVLHHAGIKIPFFIFFSRDSGLRAKDPPLHMLIAMGIAAFFSVLIGIFPGLLYSLLPNSVDYVPYTASHVLDQLQLLFFAGLAFVVLMVTGRHPHENRAITLDLDWFYRKGTNAFFWVVGHPIWKR